MFSEITSPFLSRIFPLSGWTGTEYVLLFKEASSNSVKFEICKEKVRNKITTIKISKRDATNSDLCVNDWRSNCLS